jgi:hypothetical protein
LPEIAFVINTTTLRALLYSKTLFDIWFGHQRRWLHQRRLEDSDTENKTNNDDDTASETDNNDVILSAIEAQVAKNNTKLYKTMKKKGSKTAKTFKDSEIATLFIPSKLRLSIENPRIAVRIVNKNNSRYSLLTKHAFLKGRFQGGELNKVDTITSQLLGEEIPFEL